MRLSRGVIGGLTEIYAGRWSGRPRKLEVVELIQVGHFNLVAVFRPATGGVAPLGVGSETSLLTAFPWLRQYK